ncbi:helix-turn-helix domain-containing protein [Nocardiopsis chromatogenes]|uniref:helix-turn-helix domain-containing protein n=1 Tax=Nocardiopsis chromatogenes TaxID=280239 RepID=UPI00034887B6|nr:helix-turn-helix transcriptional regulator [Nocardiopsis chromatogenes]
MSHDINPGDRIRELRRRRGMTQERLAEAAHLALPTIKKIEQGGSARMETFNAIARALGKTTLAFATPAAPTPGDDSPDASLAAIRAAINPPTGITGDPLLNLGSDEPDLVMLGRATKSVSLAYYADRYDDVARLAPSVIRSAHLHVRELDGRDKDEAHRLRADILGVAGRYLIQVRQHDLALTALRDSLRDALEIGHQPLAAAAISSQAWALMRQARFSEVEALCVRTADEIEPRMSRATSDQLSAWGWLLLRAGAAAARNNRAEESREFHSMAASAAARLHEEVDTAEHLMFGRTTVQLKTIESELVTGHPDRVLEQSEHVPGDVGERLKTGVNRHRIDQAKAHLQTGDPGAALEVLQGLRQDAPEWLRYQQAAREVAEDILAAPKRMPSAEQRELADFLGVPV